MIKLCNAGTGLKCIRYGFDVFDKFDNIVDKKLIDESQDLFVEEEPLYNRTKVPVYKNTDTYIKVNEKLIKATK